jgi:hypothetical protein
VARTRDHRRRPGGPVVSTPALVTMIVALVLVWGGLALAIAVAVSRTRADRRSGAASD